MCTESCAIKNDSQGLKWNSCTAFLVKDSGHKLKSSQIRVFVWFSTLVFPSYKMLLGIDTSFLVSRVLCMYF
jgi:hypothetical protein